MSKPPRNGDSQQGLDRLGLEQLLRWHRADQPPDGERERLLRRLRRSETRGTPDSSVAGTDPPETMRGVSTKVVALVAAAAGCMLALGATLFSAAHPSGAPRGVSSPLATTAASASPKPCWVATGNMGLLWDSSRSTPDLINADGRFGRWMHQRASEAGTSITPALVVASSYPAGAGQARYALRAEGQSAIGWGARLGVGMRVQLSPETNKVRFGCYDASAYAGVRFRASGKGIVFVTLQTTASVPPEFGGSCDNKCWFTGSHALVFNDEPREYRLTWDRFSAPDPGRSLQSHLMLLEFFVQPRPDPYEIVVDEVALLTQAEAVTESAR